MDKQNMEEKIEELLRELTLEEKLDMIHGAGLFRTEGVPRLGIPPVRFSDGPMGVRQEFMNDRWIPLSNNDDFVTYLPSNSALAASWSRELARKTGRVLGEEARGRGKDMILAPGINIKRDPLCGRNFEYMSEDPKLTEELAVPLIQGIQENDVAACVKHFALNGQETNRLMVDTEVDERTLRELYLPAFRAAVQKAGTLSLMGAYNRYDGIHCCENPRLLEEILREEWGYDGTVVSDWGAVHKTKEAAEVSMDIEMSVYPNFDEYCFAQPLKEAVERGEVKEEAVDDKVRNILRMMFRLKMLGDEKRERRAGTYNTSAHREAALRAAEESIVLLKNEQNRLPLSAEGLERLSVIGPNAAAVHSGGGGSAEIRALYEISPLMGIRMYLGGNTQVCFAEGCHASPAASKEETQGDANWQEKSLETQGPANAAKRTDDCAEEALKKRKELFEEAVALAKSTKDVILVGGLNHDFDVEGKDRQDMKLPYGQDELIEAVLDANPDTVVVLVAGSPVEMPWRDKAKAIVWCYYAGMETGAALANILFGRVNPSGRLPETFPVRYEDTPTFENGEFGREDKIVYREGLYVGYRYYEARGKRPAFCFGHGLSYSRFVYKDLRLALDENAEDGVFAEVSFTVGNRGPYEGKETAQIYVGEEAPNVDRPAKELKGFCKVAPGVKEDVRCECILTKEAFSYYDTEERAFVVKPGIYKIFVGASVEDIRLEGSLKITGTYRLE